MKLAIVLSFLAGAAMGSLLATRGETAWTAHDACAAARGQWVCSGWNCWCTPRDCGEKEKR
jgi:hypothetical protein